MCFGSDSNKVRASPKRAKLIHRRIPRRHGIDGRRQPVVAPGHGVAGIVGAQAEFHHVVFVAEPGVVVEPLGFGGHFGEKGKGRLEIGETEAAAEGCCQFRST